MSVAPNGRFLACHLKNGILTVISTTFTTKVLEFDTKSSSKPIEITWCGEDAVVLVWKNTGLVMVGEKYFKVNNNYNDDNNSHNNDDCDFNGNNYDDKINIHHEYNQQDPYSKI